MRKPLVAGSFYESDKDKLVAQIEECFEKGKGYPKPRKENTVRAAIIPHAGLFFSGKAAAQVVKEIGETKNIDTFIILGVNHSGIGLNTTTKDDFKTPLGTARINSELQKLLVKECNLEYDKEAHNAEHSIEVIIPFLQYTLEEFTFVPIIVTEDMAELGKNIRAAIDKFEKKSKKNGTVCIIASADMTHFGACYRYMPFHEDIKDKLYSLDRQAIEFILNFDADGFLKYIKETGTTICGRNTISTLIYSLENGKEKKGKGKTNQQNLKGELLDYYTSADVMGDYKTAVGYAAIVFKNKY